MRTERIGDATLYTGDVMDVLATLPDESVHCVVTSPPYWGLRDYGVPGQIGLESSPEEYVARMVEVFREVRRVLRKDGTAWVNMGDGYAQSGGKRFDENEAEAAIERGERLGYVNQPAGWTGRGDRAANTAVNGLKPKDLCGIPWMLAFALRADGWYLRSDIIWAKPNPMPESVTDRPTKAHEYLFLLSKSARYFYDAEAIKEDVTGGTHSKGPHYHPMAKTVEMGKGIKNNESFAAATWERVSSRNRRTVWTIATEPYPEAHFATFPRKLVQPCILAGCPEHACPKCGAPWEKELSRDADWRDSPTDYRTETGKPSDVKTGYGNNGVGGGHARQAWLDAHPKRVTSEHPTCACGLPPVGGVCLDPFGGSGTTAEVALEYGRRAILIELKPEYVELQKRRLAPVAGRPLLDFAGAPHA